jgi:hypothetical protein
VASFTTAIINGYAKATGIDPTITVVHPDEGMTEVVS